MPNLPHNSPHIAPKKGDFSIELPIRVKLFIFLLVLMGMHYQFMLHFKNKTKCERLEPNHVVCQQYKTLFDRAKSMFWHSSAEDTLIRYRLTGTIRKMNELYLETDLKPIFYLYRSKERHQISSAIEQIEKYIKGKGNSEMILTLDNSPEPQEPIYKFLGFLLVYLFFDEIITRKKAELDAK